MTQPLIDLSPPVSDEIRKTTCYMCACRCGINVHLKSGQVAYIEGNKDHPVNKGVLCAKGSAGIMQVNAPSRLRAPLRRVGPRGSGEFEEITWDEALDQAVRWLRPIRERAPEEFALMTGRDQSQSFTSFWAQNFGTPNYAAHGGFCSVNMAAAGIYSIGGAFWEFGQPDWDHTKLLILFGVAEDHDSNPLKIGIGQLKSRNVRVIGVNPIRTGYNAVADDWFGITPGTDGLFILSLIHCLLKAGKFDIAYLAQFTNAPCLVNSDPNSPEFGLLLRDESGKQIVIDRKSKVRVPYDQQDVYPDLMGRYRNGDHLHRSVFQHVIEKYLDDCYAPEAVSDRCGISAPRIRALAAEMARIAFDEVLELNRSWVDFRGRTHHTMKGRPISLHAMRGISAHANGFQTCRALHLLQILLGSIEVPGGFRFKPPYPKASESHPTPHSHSAPNRPLDGPHLGFVHGPEDLAVKDDGSPARIDKSFSWENPMSAHGLMYMVIANAHAGDPYHLDTLFLYMSNMAWNSSMNVTAVTDMLTDKRDDGEYVIPHIIYSDAYYSEMVAYADLILPDTTYLERHDCISLLDRPICDADAAADAIRWPVIEPDRDVRGFQTVLIDLANRLKLPGFVDDAGHPKYKDYADYILYHQRKPGIGPLAGWRLPDDSSTTRQSGKTVDGRGAPNANQINRYIANGGFWVGPIPDDAQYYKPWNKAYQNWAVQLGLLDAPHPYLFNLYLEPLRKFQLAADGHGDRQPPDHLRDRIKTNFDPLPIWYDTAPDNKVSEYPITALSQRPMAMYHSWGAQNAWLRQIHSHNPLYVPTNLMVEHDLADGDWVRVTSPHGDITAPVQEMAALNSNTIWTWNAIGKRSGTWALGRSAPEAKRGVLLNHLIHELLPEKEDGLRWANSDPITGQAAWFDLKVRIEKVNKQHEVQPRFPEIKSAVGEGPSEIRWQSES